jgi:GAF domain-containing protein
MPANEDFHLPEAITSDRSLSRVITRLAEKFTRDTLVQQTTDRLRDSLQVDRLLLYYFYRQWHGQVTFESLSAEQFSIYGSTGPDQCFNHEYAGLYLAGRMRAIADIEVEPIADCHREFLRNLQVRANLVVPILTQKGLWGLLVAHQCQSARSWSSSDIELMRSGAQNLATAPSIQSQDRLL